LTSKFTLRHYQPTLVAVLRFTAGTWMIKTAAFRYHVSPLPTKNVTSGITHVITAFANSSLFTTDPVGEYTPFMNLSDVRALFDDGTKVCMAIGGWGDTVGFGIGATNETTRKLYATNVKATMDRLGYDCVGKFFFFFFFLFPFPFSFNVTAASSQALASMMNERI
jgi:hypothetical protein